MYPPCNLNSLDLFAFTWFCLRVLVDGNGIVLGLEPNVIPRKAITLFPANIPKRTIPKRHKFCKIAGSPSLCIACVPDWHNSLLKQRNNFLPQKIITIYIPNFTVIFLPSFPIFLSRHDCCSYDIRRTYRPFLDLAAEARRAQRAILKTSPIEED